MSASEYRREALARRPVLGVLVGLGMLAVVAVPAAWFAYFSLLGFIGWSSDPEPAVGVLWGAMALVTLAVPVLIGLAVARVSLRRGHRVRIAAVAAGGLLVAVLSIWWLTKVI